MWYTHVFFWLINVLKKYIFWVFCYFGSFVYWVFCNFGSFVYWVFCNFGSIVYWVLCSKLCFGSFVTLGPLYIGSFVTLGLLFLGPLFPLRTWWVLWGQAWHCPLVFWSLTTFLSILRYLRLQKNKEEKQRQNNQFYSASGSSVDNYCSLVFCNVVLKIWEREESFLQTNCSQPHYNYFHGNPRANI